MMSRSFNQKPFEVFRSQISKVKEDDIKEAFKDTKYMPTDTRIVNFIKNTEKRHCYQGGQWSAVHDLANTDLKDKGYVLCYQNPITETPDRDSGYVLAVSNEQALKSARRNQAIIGIDGKHGLQDDGACLMTATTQHASGFGCPVSFTIMNREHTGNISLALQAIVDNVPCNLPGCSHEYQYENLPNGNGFRRVTACATMNPYKPIIMIDKFEAAASACQRLGLTYVLCWFHVVKAIMEKLKTLQVDLVSSYLIVLAFKLVARAVSFPDAEKRWAKFVTVTNNF